MTQPAEPATAIGAPALSGLVARVGVVAEWALGLLLLFVVAVNVVNASGRYLFSYRVVGADELMVYTIIFVVMAGSVLALARRDHINVNLVPSYARGRWRSFLFVLHDLAALTAAAYTARASWAYVSKIGQLDTRSMALGLPMTIPHMAVFLGFAAMTIVAAILLVADLRGLAAPGASR